MPSPTETKRQKFYDNMVELAGDYDDKIHNKENGSPSNQPKDSANVPNGREPGDISDEEYESRFHYGGS